MIEQLDALIASSLHALAADPHVRTWRAKEKGWVNYYALRHLLACCTPMGPLRDPAQLAIEGAVAQPPGNGKPTVARDLVIWAEPGGTCWNHDWVPCQHPVVIMEWKVHRPKRRNREVTKERHWLRQYCTWQPQVLAYAIEVDEDRRDPTLTCARYLGMAEDADWLLRPLVELPPIAHRDPPPAS